MSKTKVKIVNKTKEGVLISPAKGAELLKMGWLEFKENYIVEDNVWAIPTKKYQAKLDEIDKHVAEAAKNYDLAGGLDDSSAEGVAHLTKLASEVQTIIELSGFTHDYVMSLVKNKIDNNKKKAKKERKADKKKAKEIKFNGYTTSAALADNPALQKLKEKFGK